jgi:hypothetical protein
VTRVSSSRVQLSISIPFSKHKVSSLIKSEKSELVHSRGENGSEHTFLVKKELREVRGFITLVDDFLL